MFSTERNFIIVFLVVFFEIDQGINCVPSNDYFNLYTPRPAYLPRLSSRRQTTFAINWNMPPTASVSRDNITERRQVPKQLYSFSSLPTRTLPKNLEVSFFDNVTKKSSKDKDATEFTSKDTTKKAGLVCNGVSCSRIEDSSTTNGNPSNELLEPKRDGCIYNITSLDQYNKYSQGIDYSVIFFSSLIRNEKENCEALKHLLNDVLINSMYKNIKLYGVNIQNCNDVARHFEIKSGPSVVSLRMQNVIDILRPENLLDGSNTNDKIVSMLNKLLDSKVQANGSSGLTEPTMSEKIYNITSLEQYLKYCQTTEYAILFFTSPDELKACEDVEKILKETLTQPFSDIKIYRVNVKNQDLSEYFKMKSAPVLRSLRQNKEIQTLGSAFAQQTTFVQAMFSSLISAPVPETPQENTTSTTQSDKVMVCGDCTPKKISPTPAVRVLPKSTSSTQGDKVMVCGDCTPKTISPTPAAQSDKVMVCGDCTPKKISPTPAAEASKKNVYNRLNPPNLNKTDILYDVINRNAYEDYVKNTELAVIDFGYDDCPGCKITYSILKNRMKLVQENQKIILYSVNIDKCQAVANLYGVTMAPTLIFLHMGKEIGRFGPKKSQSDNEIQNMFNKLLELKMST